MKTLIFDLDGTILDTLQDLKNAVNHALNFYNLPEKDLEFVRKAIGNGTTVLIQRCTPSSLNEKDREMVFKEFKEYYLSHYAVFTRPYPGIKEMVLKLKGLVRLVVVSNKDHDLTNKIINRVFPQVFDIIQGSYLNHPKKPNPYLINKVLNENNISKSDCLYIGDTDVDKESAIQAGLKYCLVNYGYRTKKELDILCPNEETINDVDALYNYILKWVNL